MNVGTVSACRTEREMTTTKNASVVLCVPCILVLRLSHNTWHLPQRRPKALEESFRRSFLLAKHMGAAEKVNKWTWTRLNSYEKASVDSTCNSILKTNTAHITYHLKFMRLLKKSRAANLLENGPERTGTSTRSGQNRAMNTPPTETLQGLPQRQLKC